MPESRSLSDRLSIPDRLREHQSVGLFADAADEVERLQQELDLSVKLREGVERQADAEVERLRHDWHAQVGVLDDEVEHLEIEVERLREALREIRDSTTAGDDLGDIASRALDEEEAT